MKSKRTPEFTILGAGLSGISASYHLGHERCVVFEKKPHAGGHIHSDIVNGFTWDEGPHVSFTKNEYVRQLLAESINNEFLEYPVYPINYYKGNWIPHPAQSNLYAVPEPLRTQCLNSFLSSRNNDKGNGPPANYEEWLNMAFGETFASTFPYVYTEKYWTLPPAMLSTDWIGNRVFFPDVDIVKKGYAAPLDDSTHYISSVRYPVSGGYYSYASLLLEGINISYHKEVQHVDLASKTILFADGSTHTYETLISTLPVTVFIQYCRAPQYVNISAGKLLCSELLLVNLEVNHPPVRTEQWLYVYDNDKYSTRINFTDLLSPNNAPENKCGIQVEVYFSKYKPKDKPDHYYAQRIIDELIEMGLIRERGAIDDFHTKWIPFANVVFDHDYKDALNTVLEWLSESGLKRESDDLLPMTDWSGKLTEDQDLGSLILAGRFGQWKYFWSDDCILRGKLIGERAFNKNVYLPAT